MIKDKMAVGVVKNSLMVRLDPALYESSLEKTGCRPMDFTGQVVKGFLFVDPIGIDLQNDLEYWIQLCLNYNPKAKSSKRTAPAKKQKPALKKKKY